MKSLQQQKAETLDEFMIILSKCDAMAISDNVKVLKTKYAVLLTQKTPSQNPYIDDVFKGRLYYFLIHWLDFKNRPPRLSDCPHINYLKNQRGIGLISLNEYESVMEKYNFPEKIS